MIGLLSVAFILSILILIIYASIRDAKYSFIVVVLTSIIVVSTILLLDEAIKETAVKCLKGHNPYKMDIKYELKDSVYIPIDTVYTKIKESI